MRKQLLDAMPRPNLPIPAIIRRQPLRSAAIAGATVLCGAMLVVVLQAHSPAPGAVEAAAASPQDAVEEVAANPIDDVVSDIQPVELAMLADTGGGALPTPETDRWAVGAEPIVRRVDELALAVEEALSPEQDRGVDLAPDPMLTAAVDPVADVETMPNGVSVAVAENEVEIAALESRMAAQDAAVFALQAEANAQGEPMGQGLVTSYVNMRAGPENDAEILKVLPQNATVAVLDTCPNWCQIEHEGVRGFVYGSFIDRGQTSAMQQTGGAN